MMVDESPQELTPQQAVELGAHSLTMFGKLFLPRTFRQESPSFHEAIGNALYSTNRYNAIEVFRDGAKTTLLRAFTLQRISYAISRTIMYVSVSQPHAILSVRWLKRQIQHNTRVTQTFGLRPGEKWSDEIAEIWHGVEDTPITVLAAGVTGQIRGFNIDDYRPDLIIIDDVLNEENTATPEQRRKMLALLDGALLNSLAPATESPLAKAVFLQTPFHREDAIETYMNDPQWHGLRFGVFDEEGNSRWESRYPKETLLAEKAAAVRRGAYAIWMREKECKIVKGEHKAFNVENLQFFDAPPKGMYVVIAIDPASSEKKSADDNAIVVLGFKGVNVYLLDYHLAKGMMPDATAARFFEFVMMYRPAKATVEVTSYQRVLKWYIEQEMVKRRLFIPIDAVDEKRRSKNDRIIQALAGLVSYKYFNIRSAHRELISQMDDFNPETKDNADDLLDACAIAIVSYNPALRSKGIDIEGTVVDMLDESEYEPIEVERGCP